ncbi:4'-phosphopantetheinyl transferase family protein [Ensifer aridi]|uniref:4'-phosphopantetheinyl transferase family protein n=1 Tax=Ensifer aridi TaxID=1708715 RepID=UPI0011117FCC|nr:hypothetical protein [Ensifer aridi]
MKYSFPSLDIPVPAVLRLGTVVIALESWSAIKERSYDDFLGDGDKSWLAGLQSSQRRAEFIAGRAALHHAGTALSYDVTGMHIVYDPGSGKPQFTSLEDSFHFSITHTKGLAGCIASRNSLVGCDCERWDRVIEPQELSFDLFGRAFMSKRDFLIEWTRLEALLKLHGRKLSDVIDRRVQPLPGAIIEAYEDDIDAPAFKSSFELNGEFVFSYCVGQICENPAPVKS